MSDMQKKDEAMAAAQAPDPKKKEKDKDKAPAKKKDKEKKPGIFARIGRWFREMRSELKKVSWPTAQATMKNVGIVIACVLVVGVFIWVFDGLTHAVIQALLNLF